MKLIRFDANKLPFQPMEKQVIYFDASPYSLKMSYGIAVIVDRYYNEICNMFAAQGLEFCFLPRISRTLQLPELLSYFRPDLPPEAQPTYLKTVSAENLASYFANEEDIDDLPMGFIKYTGQRFGNDYVFSYMPIHGETVEQLFMAVKYYLQFNSEQSDSNRHDERGIQLSRAARNRSIFKNASHCSIEEESLCLPSEAALDRSIMEEAAPSSIADDPCDIESMLTQAQLLVQRLREQGVNDLVIEEIFHPTQRLSRLHVRYSRIFLPDYQNMEIKMTPLPKAVFLLYLKHPEGIRFCDLPDYRDELLHIYAGFSGRDSMDDIRASIEDVTNPLSNSINEKCSRIRQAFLSKFEDRLARNYYITGPRGETKKILLPRDLVTWEE